MIEKDIAILASWAVHKDENNRYSILYTHLVYLEYITRNFNKVYLISSVKIANNSDNLINLHFDNLEIIELPFSNSLIRSQLLFIKYYKAIRLIAPKVDLFYCRVPDPFCWMPQLMFKKKTIMHFVGDTIEAARVNENWSRLKKRVLITGYLLDYSLTLKAAKSSLNFSNGHHISEKLKQFKISVNPLVSSTVKESEIINEIKTKSINKELRLVYTGYLRYWKGIKTLFELIKLLKTNNINFTMDVLGDGDMFSDFQQFIKDEKLLEKIRLHGMVNDRNFMNSIYRDSDIYLFTSLGGEGSPRSVIEAMAQGLSVISTPVGSLPTTFKDREDIRFAKFDNAESFLNIIYEYLADKESFYDMRVNALNKVKCNFTRDAFLSKIFYYEA